MGFAFGQSYAKLVSRVQGGGIARQASIGGADECKAAIERVLRAGGGQSGRECVQSGFVSLQALVDAAEQHLFVVLQVVAGVPDALENEVAGKSRCVDG